MFPAAEIGPPGAWVVWGRRMTSMARAQFGSRRMIAGAVLTEQIFTVPGFGKLVVDAVFNRD